MTLTTAHLMLSRLGLVTVTPDERRRPDGTVEDFNRQPTATCGDPPNIRYGHRDELCCRQAQLGWTEEVLSGGNDHRFHDRDLVLRASRAHRPASML
jgi:hypothetical protein